MSVGAPETACGSVTDIEPSHPGSRQMSAVPYTVNISDFTGMMYTPGQTYTSEWFIEWLCLTLLFVQLQCMVGLILTSLAL